MLENRIKCYKISQSDIDKVPRARIFGNEKDKIIQMACQEVLRMSMEREDGWTNDEVGLLIDLNGRVQARLYGKNGRIPFTNDTDYFNATSISPNLSLAFIHNHPDNSHISLNDIVEFLLEDSIVLLIAVGNNGVVQYLIKINQNTNIYSEIGSKLYDTFLVSKNVSQLEHNVLKACNRIGLKYKISKRRK